MRVLGLVLVATVSGCAGMPQPDFEPVYSTSRDPATVLVTPERTLDRVCVLIDVLDFHSPADSEDKGFAALRERAAELGADAVIGAEFEHGEEGELSHLSGMAVRYGDVDAGAFEVLGEIDIATPEDADDKGHDQLLRRARALGADEIRNIEFEHGEEGGMSHLRGLAVVHVPG